MITVETVPAHIRWLAEILWRLSPDEIDQLTKLVPALTPSPHTTRAWDETEAINYFQQKAQVLGKLPSQHAEFIAGLTYTDFFSMSPLEQDAVWDTIFEGDEEGAYSLEEIDIQPDAIVASQQKYHTLVI